MATLIEVAICGLGVVFVTIAIPLMVGSASINPWAAALGHHEPIVRLGGTSDCHQIWVQRGFDKIEKLDPHTCETETIYHRTGMPIIDASFSVDASTYILALCPNEILICRGTELLLSQSVELVELSTVLRVVLSKDGRIALGFANGTQVHRWDVSGRVAIQSTFVISEPIDRFALSAEGDLFAASSAAGALTIYDTRTGKCRRTLSGEGIVMADPTFSSNGRWLAVARTNSICLYDVVSGELVWNVPTEDYRDFNCVEISSNEEWVAAVGSATRLNLLKLATGEVAHRFSSESAMLSLAFERSNEILYAGCADGSIPSWSLVTGKELNKLPIGAKSH